MRRAIFKEGVHSALTLSFHIHVLELVVDAVFGHNMTTLATSIISSVFRLEPHQIEKIFIRVV